MRLVLLGVPASREYTNQAGTSPSVGGKCSLPLRPKNAPLRLTPAATHSRLRSQLLRAFARPLTASNCRTFSKVSALLATLAILALGPPGAPSPEFPPSSSADCVDDRPKSVALVEFPASQPVDIDAFRGHSWAIANSLWRLPAPSAHSAVAANRNFKGSCLCATPFRNSSITSHSVSSALPTGSALLQLGPMG